MPKYEMHPLHPSLAPLLVAEIEQALQVSEGDFLDISDVALRSTPDRLLVWCRYELIRTIPDSSPRIGAVLAWFLGEGMPPVIQLFEKSL